MFRIKNLPDGQRQLVSLTGSPVTVPMEASSAINLWRLINRRLTERLMSQNLPLLLPHQFRSRRRKRRSKS